MLISKDLHALITTYVSVGELNKVVKISINYKCFKRLQWARLLGYDWYKSYYLKISYKNGSEIYRRIPFEVRNQLQPCLTLLNHKLSTGQPLFETSAV